MFNNKNIDELRKPVSQVLSLFALFMIFYSSITLMSGLKYDDLPLHLKLTTFIELLIIVLCLLQFIRFINFDKDKNQNNKIYRRYSKFLLIVNILATWNTIFAFNNLFYFIAAKHNANVYDYWLFGFMSMLICFILGTVGAVLMTQRFNKIEKLIGVKVKTFIGILLIFLSQFIYIGKIIEYNLVPEVADSKYLILGSIALIFAAKFINFTWVLKYSRLNIPNLKEESK
ncbi:DUF5079 family protein [Mammaliicoccus sp. Dog046]|uniref:DUF5079 family protein n=1 Tax=Mammaliicoccus sp. Dog046 TaxID=3034233 RepID=UPI002B260BF1|nr:DUF5079 family protein [Mammaliicoccus sp. Dog046]WQK85598.1 DUF5079 family protein [Mammaliicoccus sp. Dog046]